ncbi:class I SAM-dependent methyltransferase [Streptomyces sp. NPDC049954]|uniref:class I SAM-dependent methyltransferase n=1 Tax=Streptomyces sp. NPDC049954 TaxID=3155779 RepID=UPI0034332429
MFTSRGPSLRELTVQALSSVEQGYDLLAPKFDHTPFRTPERWLTAVTTALRPLGPFDAGLDVCTGTGAGLDVLRPLCATRVTGVDFSAGMLEQARHATGGGPGGPGRPTVDWVRADALALPFRQGYDLAVSFGASGHFLPAERPRLFNQVRQALRPGGMFAFPLAAPPRPSSAGYWATSGFDAAMRVRNLVRRPSFVMYYRTWPLGAVRDDLLRAGFEVRLLPLKEFGRRSDGSPRCRLVVARRF